MAGLAAGEDDLLRPVEMPDRAGVLGAAPRTWDDLDLAAVRLPGASVR